ncbi:MAG: sigma-54-dependent Fis family transcriptional regulator [Myxococcota bacterium]
MSTGGRTPAASDVTVDATHHAADPSARGSAARLCAVSRDGVVAVIDLGPERVILGRAPDSPGGVALAHPTVSRQHAVIEWDAALGRHLAKDLGSRNGTTVDGKSAGGAWCALLPGSVLRTGNIVFAYELGHTLVEPDAPAVSSIAVPGDAIAVRKLRRQIAAAAPDLSPALIIGETGTGKEQIAREIHRLSGRSGAFIPVNCATFGEQLIESQLFGHLRGSFTGAINDQEGLFMAAKGGTLFLDEIGEMPLELQPKLLRAIQEREVRPVGSTKTSKIDVRVVAATHRALAEKARSGVFRQDLYARLAMWQIDVPSLRERRADLSTWLDLLLNLWREERGLAPGPALMLNADALETLMLSAWPENLRGLSRFVHEVAHRAGQQALKREQLPAWVST